MKRLLIATLSVAFLVGACSDDSGPAGPSASEKLLTKKGFLDDGKVLVGLVAPDDEAIDHAICDYVFGIPDEVASLAKVDGEVALAEESGYQQLGGGGSGASCRYTVEGEEAFGLWLWTDETEIDDDDAEFVVVQTQVTGGHFGLVAQMPEWDGELGLDPEAATEWLEDAATRYSGGSI